MLFYMSPLREDGAISRGQEIMKERVKWRIRGGLRLALRQEELFFGKYEGLLYRRRDVEI